MRLGLSVKIKGASYRREIPLFKRYLCKGSTLALKCFVLKQTTDAFASHVRWWIFALKNVECATGGVKAIVFIVVT